MHIEIHWKMSLRSLFSWENGKTEETKFWQTTNYQDEYSSHYLDKEKNIKKEDREICTYTNMSWGERFLEQWRRRIKVKRSREGMVFPEKSCKLTYIPIQVSGSTFCLMSLCHQWPTNIPQKLRLGLQKERKLHQEFLSSFLITRSKRQTILDLSGNFM